MGRTRRARCSQRSSAAGGCPPVVGRVEPGAPLEFDKLWRIAQARSDRPVKFGTVSTQLAREHAGAATPTSTHANKRELMWDMATAMNGELRRLADAGCKVIQIEEPLMHFVAGAAPATSGIWTS